METGCKCRPANFSHTAGGDVLDNVVQSVADEENQTFTQLSGRTCVNMVYLQQVYIALS